MKPSADIYLLGSGVFSFLDITLYTQKILRQCKTVFYLHDLPTLARFLKEITPNPVNLMPQFYLDGKKRADIYRDIARHVMDGAEREKPIAFLVHGHPLVYSSISRLILDACKERGTRVEIVPAVSSLDRMFVDLGLDIADRGLQVFPASMAIGDGIVLNPNVDAIFFQIGNALSPLANRQRETLAEEVTPIKEYLLAFYPSAHVVYVVESAVELGFTSRITPSELGRLERAAAVMNYTASLFIPALDAGQARGLAVPGHPSAP